MSRSTCAPFAALPCFAPITQDGTAWALVYFGLIHRAGVGRYVGGTGAITDALQRCFVHHGGQTRCSTVVEEVLVDRGRVAGVRLASGDELYARTVITSCNVKSVLTTLLPNGALHAALSSWVRPFAGAGVRRGAGAAAGRCPARRRRA